MKQLELGAVLRLRTHRAGLKYTACALRRQHSCELPLALRESAR